MGLVWTASAQQPSYLDLSLPPEQRWGPGAPHDARRKGQSRQPGPCHSEIECARLRLGSEALHGFARDGTTEFPEPIGLAAAFDPGTIPYANLIIESG